MDVNGLISAASQLFNEKKYAEAIEKLHQAWDAITDKSTRIAEQIGIQSWFGCCYFEQAMKAKDADSADKLFRKAIEHHREWLRLGKNNIQQQIYAKSWIIKCYFEQAQKTKNTDKAGKLFEQAIECCEKLLLLADQLTDDSSISQKAYAQTWFIVCYAKQAKKTRDADKADNLLEKAIEHNQKWLRFIDEQNIQEQINARSWLGDCYLERAKRNKGISKIEKFIKQASEDLSSAYEQLSKLSDEAEKKGMEKKHSSKLKRD